MVSPPEVRATLIHRSLALTTPLPPSGILRQSGRAIVEKTQRDGSKVGAQDAL
jgi:hypothetical protein